MTESEFVAFKSRVDEDRAFIHRTVMPWRVTHVMLGKPVVMRRDGPVNGASISVESYYVVISVTVNNTKSSVMLPESTSIEEAMSFADDILKRHGVVFIEPDAVVTASPDAVSNTVPGADVTPSGCCITPTDK